MKHSTCGLLLLICVAVAGSPALVAAAPDSATAGLVKTYGAIADTILAANDAEEAVMRGILEAERDQALAALDRSDLRAAATHIGNFATEGGAAVEPIRSRLLKGGHHHQADDTGPNAAYDEGYVVLTKKLKQEALELAKRCGKAGEAAKADATEVAAIKQALNSLAGRALSMK